MRRQVKKLCKFNTENLKNSFRARVIQGFIQRCISLLTVNDFDIEKLRSLLVLEYWAEDKLDLFDSYKDFILREAIKHKVSADADLNKIRNELNNTGKYGERREKQTNT